VLFPNPVPGLVVRYSYLWYREHLVGREEGQKDRPCAIVAAIRTDGEQNLHVLVLPVTHTPPESPELAVEIPMLVKQRLHLDAEHSWVVVSEWNEFIWPGPDLRRAPGGGEGTVAYGMLPPALFGSIRGRFLALVRDRRGRPVVRTE
jgi:hypothetical protein